MTIALLCSGQGNQHPAMFALTGDVPDAAPLFAAAGKALGGRDPRILVKTDEDAMHTNRAGQVLCCTQALASFAALGAMLGSRIVVAGYSVGELAGWGCAGAYTAETIIDLAVERATLMDAAGGPGEGLAFVRGLDRAAIARLCANHGAAIAIVNPGDMVVIGGPVHALDALCDAAMSAGAVRTGRLKVAVASHTPRLAAATPAFRAALAAAAPTARLAPGIRLFSGIDGAPVLSIPDGLDKLAAQISQTIDWSACLGACIEAGVDTFLELGPGNALATMAASAYPDIRARALDDFRTLAGVKSWLAAA